MPWVIERDAAGLPTRLRWSATPRPAPIKVRRRADDRSRRLPDLQAWLDRALARQRREAAR